MNIQDATRRYEAWLRRFAPLVPADIDEKHRRMALAPFRFMRATFYRWCALWRKQAGDEARAARVLAIGDLHLENFGTWRDADGRLVWGINDFDEVTPLPWTQDLIRLGTSAHLAIGEEHIGLRRRTACGAILEGYRDGIASGGRPFVLEEEHGWLRQVATSALRSPTVFWQRMNALRTARSVNATAAAAIRRAMPAELPIRFALPSRIALPIRFARRVAGMGSLGRARVVGIAEWRGGKVAREAKALAPSAWVWASGARGGSLVPYMKLIDRAVRVPDPTVRVIGRWLVRRLAPDCSKIELADLPDGHDEAQLLYAMGFETANIHLGTKGARRAIRRELRTRNARWLHDLAKSWSAAVLRDWQRWRAR